MSPRAADGGSAESPGVARADGADVPEGKSPAHLRRAGDDAYGRLAVFTHGSAASHVMLDVPPGAFVPPPKVDVSVVVSLRGRQSQPLADDALETVTAAAFGQRRKMLRESLKSLGIDPLRLVAAAGIDPTRRAETVPIDGFVAMARELSNIRATS